MSLIKKDSNPQKNQKTNTHIHSVNNTEVHNHTSISVFN